MLIAALPLVAASCDPTEDTFAVKLLNDTDSAVTVRQCDVRRNAYHEVHALDVGQSVTVNTSASHVDNWWVIEGGSGQRLGCLNLLFDQKRDNVIVGASQRIACPP